MTEAVADIKESHAKFGGRDVRGFVQQATSQSMLCSILQERRLTPKSLRPHSLDAGPGRSSG